MRCHHEHDDGAYVLGALSPAERTAYERHLATCSFCREAVAELAVLPGLLGKLDSDDFARLLEPDMFELPAQYDRIPDLASDPQATRRRERRRSRQRTVGTSVAAAALALLVGAVGVLAWRDSAAPKPFAGTAAPKTLSGATVDALPMVAMQAVAGRVPVTAEVKLIDVPWGTEVEMKCAYEKTSTSAKGYTFRLMAIGPDDAKEQLGSWMTVPGGPEVLVSGTTKFTGSELSRLELVRYDNTPILAYDVP